MAGATNKSLKAVGFKQSDIKKIRTTAGAGLSVKSAIGHAREIKAWVPTKAVNHVNRTERVNAMNAASKAQAEKREATKREPPKKEPPPKGPQLAHMGTEAFGDHVFRSLGGVKKTWGGDRVFIHHAYDHLKEKGMTHGMTLDDFKTKLLEAHRAGQLSLRRADLVEAMHPKDVDDSNLFFKNSRFSDTYVFNFIQKNKRGNNARPQ